MDGFLRVVAFFDRSCVCINVFPSECDASILSTEEKPEIREEESEEQKREVDPRSTTNAVSQPQRIPLFPGMDPSALKVMPMDPPTETMLVGL